MPARAGRTGRRPEQHQCQVDHVQGRGATRPGCGGHRGRAGHPCRRWMVVTMPRSIRSSPPEPWRGQAGTFGVFIVALSSIGLVHARSERCRRRSSRGVEMTTAPASMSLGLLTVGEEAEVDSTTTSTPRLAPGRSAGSAESTLIMPPTTIPSSSCGRPHTWKRP